MAGFPLVDSYRVSVGVADEGHETTTSIFMDGGSWIKLGAGIVGNGFPVERFATAGTTGNDILWSLGRAAPGRAGSPRFGFCNFSCESPRLSAHMPVWSRRTIPIPPKSHDRPIRRKLERFSRAHAQESTGGAKLHFQPAPALPGSGRSGPADRDDPVAGVPPFRHIPRIPALGVAHRIFRSAPAAQKANPRQAGLFRRTDRNSGGRMPGTGARTRTKGPPQLPFHSRFPGPRSPLLARYGEDETVADLAVRRGVKVHRLYRLLDRARCLIVTCVRRRMYLGEEPATT